jgi:hypothetical protein
MIGFAHEIDRTIDVVVSFDDIDMRALIPIVRRCQALMDRRSSRALRASTSSPHRPCRGSVASFS